MVDMLSGGSQRPPWSRWRWVVLGGLALVVVGTVFWSTRPDRAGRRSPGALAAPSARSSTSAALSSNSSPESSPSSVSSTGRVDACDEFVGRQAPPLPDLDGIVALALSPLTGRAVVRGGALDRVDPSAAAGPWSVLLRSAEGSFAKGTAVLTFPVATTTSKAGGVASGGPTVASSGQLLWPIGGGYARLRGDLPLTTLDQVMSNTRVIDGRPQASPPPGLTVVASMRYRGEHLRELRYNGSALGTGVLDGLVYTGILRGSWFEDQLLTTGGRPCGTVGGRPAVVSSVLGGNGTLAWEYAPGVVGFIGYSGSDLTGSVLTALRELAASARPVDDQAWMALAPQAVSGSWSD